MHNIRKIRTTAEQRQAARKKEAIEQREYLSLESKVFDARENPGDLKESLELTTNLLKLNPEHYTIWNFRRELLMKIGEKDLIKNDLALLDGILVRMPKVYWVWNHRRWVLEQLGEGASWDHELALVNKALGHDARNFHGWHYRRTVIHNLEAQKQVSMVKQELDYTTSKINANFSNFSAWFHRSQLVVRLENVDKTDLLKKELEYARSAIFMDPEDQSAWIYYRWLLTFDYFREAQPAVLEGEYQQISGLADEEPDSVLCLYTLWVLAQLTHRSQPELMDRVIKLDPLRSERYKYMRDHLTSQNQLC